MKNLFLIILLAPFLLISQSKQAIDTVNTDQLEYKDGLRYKIDTNEPFTGVWTGKWPDGQKQFEYRYVDGLQDGLSTVRWRNGGKQTESNWKKGELDGLKISWGRNGNKLTEINYKNDETPRKKTERYFKNDLITKVEEYILKSNTWKRARIIRYYGNGKMQSEIIYNNKDFPNSETTWYSDGSNKEEKIYVGDKLNHKIWDHNGNELLLEALIPKDTIDVEEIEWKGSEVAYIKGNDKPFTGLVTLPGVLNYPRNNKRHWHVPNNQYFTTATIVHGRFNGPYTKWHKKNGQKKSEITITGDWYKIIPNGPYANWYEDGQIAAKGNLRDGKKNQVNTTWYENGQMSSKGYFFHGEIDGKMTIWYKNGQIKREGIVRNGKRTGKFIIWDENGKKSFEATYYNGKTIKTIEKDENGNIVKEWPEVDEDKYGLKIFLNEFISILKTKKYDDIKNLMASKEEYINYWVWVNGKELPNEMLEKINDIWTEEYKDEQIDDIKKEVDIEYIFKDRTISNIIYKYYLVNEDKTTEEIEWPKSINFELQNAKYIVAEITILLGDYRPIIIEIRPFYLNNKWCFMLNERHLVEVKL